MTGRLSRAISRYASRTFAALSVVLAVVALPAGVAVAATAAATTYSLQYTAAAGEANVITIDLVDGNIVFTDSAGITITPSGGCTVLETTATCPARYDIQVLAGDLNDTVTVAPAMTGGVTVRGGEGDDQLTNQSPVAYANFSGEAGADTLSGGNRPDYLAGGAGDDHLVGGAGNDTLYGEDGRDDLLGGEGRDMLDAGIGSGDDVQGGSGIDHVSYNYRPASLAISLDDQANDGESGENDNVHSDVENLQTGGGDDTITGTDARNRLYGGGGSDIINGGGGNDFLYGQGGFSGDVLNGQDGDDRLYGEEWSPDTFSGGAGWDFVPFERYEDVRVSLNNIADDGVDGELDNVKSDVEEVTTGYGDDVVVGSSAGNEFATGPGNDTVSGGGGNDGLAGGAGRDVINGGNGIDSLEGQDGGDTLVSQDASKDYVDCGGALDSLDRDPSDRVQPNCEVAT